MIGDRLGFFTKPFLFADITQSISRLPSVSPPQTIPIPKNVVKNVIKSILMYNDVDFIPSLRRKDEKIKRHHVLTVTNKSIREVRL